MFVATFENGRFCIRNFVSGAVYQKSGWYKFQGVWCERKRLPYPKLRIKISRTLLRKMYA